MCSILVVDDDPTSLFVAEICLKRCNYEVMAVSHPLEALSILDKSQTNKNEKTYDMILADVHMPYMNGFQLMERVTTQFNLPVILISADDRNEVMRRGLHLGAQAYLVKPIKAQQARLMWQHSICWKNKDKYGFSKANIPRTIGSSSSTTPEAEDNPRERKTTKIEWKSNLHNRFVEAMLILGYEDAIPRNILEVMNVGSLNREQVASHVQKFMKFLEKVLNGETSLCGSRKKWIDCFYYSSIVHGNPNQIFTSQLQEQRRTGKPAAPIPASLPLPPFNEAESSSSRSMNITMLMPNSYAFPPVNVATPTVPGLGRVGFQSPVNAVPMLMNEELGNVQLDPNIGSSFAAIEFGNAAPMLMNEQVLELVDQVQMDDGSKLISNNFGVRDDSLLGFGPEPNQLGSVQLDPITGSSWFGNPSAMHMNEQARQLGRADNGSSLISNNIEMSSIPAATDNSHLDNQDDWLDDLLMNLRKDDDYGNNFDDYLGML